MRYVTRGRGRYSTRAPRQTDYSCSNCNTRQPEGRCPAFGKECNYCHVKNHFYVACRKRLSNKNFHYMRQSQDGMLGDLNEHEAQEQFPQARDTQAQNVNCSVHTVAQDDVFLYGLYAKTDQDNQVTIRCHYDLENPRDNSVAQGESH